MKKEKWIIAVLLLLMAAVIVVIVQSARVLLTTDKGSTVPEPAATAAAAPAPTPGESPAAAATITPASTPAAVPSATPVPAPTAPPSPTPAPTQKPTPTPVPEYLTKYPNNNQYLRVTKDPEGVQVLTGANAVFTSTGANYSWCAWRFVSPEGKELIFDVANTQFPGIWTTGGNGLTFSVFNIPASMDGWKVVCLFSDGAGNYVLSGEALVKVDKNSVVPPAPAQGTVTTPPAAAPNTTPAPVPEAPAPVPETSTTAPITTPVPGENETPIF